jgi:HEAT repeat protein
VPAVLCTAVFTLAPPARAAVSDRIAVEQLSGETPLDAALAYMSACFRRGAALEDVEPVASFQLEGTGFVRLRLSGPASLRCMGELTDRDSIDGSIRWFDGPPRALLHRPKLKSDVEVEDKDWFNAPNITPPSLDRTLLHALEQGSAEARRTLSSLPADAAINQAKSLQVLGSPGALAALEVIAVDDPRWSVRRVAVQALHPVLSANVLLNRVDHDPAWQVRLAAVGQVGRLAASDDPRAQEGAEALLRVLRGDHDWTVQRQAIWSMTSAQVRRANQALRELIHRPDVDSRVHAAVLEVLGGAGLVTPDDLDPELANPAAGVRAVAAELLSANVTAAESAKLWRALNDRDRLVRLAAAPFLARVDDDTIGPDLWRLYVTEADELDADADFEHVVLDTLARHPFAGFPDALLGRLQRPLRPEERRLLSRTLATVAPAAAFSFLQPSFSAQDPVLRSIAADAVPDNPTTHEARLKLLADPDADVRAGALLGLCRSASKPMMEEAENAQLENTALGQEAAAAATRCGHAPINPPRLRTHLAGPDARESSGAAVNWPAVLAIVLIIASVLGVKLQRPRDTNPPLTP